MNRNLISIVGAPIILVAGACAAIAAPPDKVTSNLVTPIDMLVEGTNQTIAISGKLHVVTRVESSGESMSVQIHTNFAETVGVGLSTGESFRIRGSQTVSLEDVPFDSVEFMTLVTLVMMQDAQTNAEIIRELMLRLKYNNAKKLVGLEVMPIDPCGDSPSD